MDSLIVCGGGIAGLAAAWEATLLGVRSITVLEADPVLGGKIRTGNVGGEMVDEGADAFLIRVPAALDLCRELGIADELINPSLGTAELWWQDKRHAYPSGLTLGVPTSPELLDGCTFVAPAEQARIRSELETAADPLDGDVSIGEYMRSHFGDTITELLIEPLIGGINAGVADRLSMAAVAPQLADAARAASSLAAELTRRAAQSQAPNAPTGAIFAAPPTGMRHLIDVLVERLRDAGVELRTSSPVVSVARTDAVDTTDEPDGVRVVVQIGAGRNGSAETLVADGVVIATPAPAAAALVGSSSDLIASIRTASVVVVVLVFDEQIDNLNAAGLLIPRTDRSTPVTAISFGSSKWRRLAANGRTVLRVSLGYDGFDDCIEWSDERLIAEATAQAKRLLAIESAPSATRVSRWPQGFSQYAPGHLELVDRIEATLAEELGNVAIAGSSFHGIGIPSSIASGRNAARKVVSNATAG